MEMIINIIYWYLVGVMSMFISIYFFNISQRDSFKKLDIVVASILSLFSWIAIIVFFGGILYDKIKNWIKSPKVQKFIKHLDKKYQGL